MREEEQMTWVGSLACLKALFLCIYAYMLQGYYSKLKQYKTIFFQKWN